MLTDLQLISSKKVSKDMRQKLVNDLPFEELRSFAKNPNISESTAKLIINHPEVDWRVLEALAYNSNLSESFHKEYTIKHPKFDSDALWVLKKRFPGKF